MTRKTAFLSLIFLFLLIPSIAQSGITQLTADSFNDYDPQINDSGQVVWYRYDGSDYEIYLYNGTTTVQLTID